MAQVYNNDVPTNETLAEETWPELAKTNGFEITSSDGVGATATNFSSIVSKMTSANPDAVVMHLTGAQHVTFATALKRAGYQGKVAGGAGLGAGILKPMGDQADGILFPIDFSAANPTRRSRSSSTPTRPSTTRIRARTPLTPTTRCS